MDLGKFKFEQWLSLETMSEESGLSVSLLSRIITNQHPITKRTSNMLFEAYGIRFTNDISQPKIKAMQYKERIEVLEREKRKLTKDYNELVNDFNELEDKLNDIQRILNGRYFLVPKDRGGVKDV